jgi:hypothetical protein
MALKSIPPEGVVGEVNSHDDLYKVAGDTRDVVRQSPLQATPTTVGIVSGVLTVTTSAFIRLETEGLLSTDILDRISLSGVPDGQVLVLCLNNGARTVRVTNLVNGGSGNGELDLRIGEEETSLLLDDPREFLWVKRIGGQYVEFTPGARNGGSGLGNPLTADLDAAGQAIFGASFLPAGVAGTVSSYTVSIDDIGKLLTFYGAATVVLPDPNENDAQGRPWPMGANIPWAQTASSLIFRTHTNAAPVNVANHDRGAGSGALGVAVVLQSSSGAKYWVLAGATAGFTPTVGSQRDYVSTNNLPDFLSNASSTAWQTAATFSHQPGASEQWIYIASYLWRATGLVTENPGQTRLVSASGTEATLVTVGRPFIGVGRTALGLLWGVSHGASPGTYTLRIDVMNGAAGFQTYAQTPLVVGLKLTTGENFTVQGAAVANATTTYSNTVSCTITSAAAGDYYVIAGCQWTHSVLTGTAKFQLTQGGSAVAGTETTPVGRNSLDQPGYHTVMQKVTHTSGSLTVALQGARSSGTGTVTTSAGTIVILRASAFEQTNFATDTDDDINITVTPAVSLTTSVSLKSGWKTLALGNLQGWGASGTNTTSYTRADWNRNGEVLTPSQFVLGSRITDTWDMSSSLPVRLLDPAQASDVFTFTFAQNTAGPEARLRGESMLFLAMKPA